MSKKIHRNIKAAIPTRWDLRLYRFIKVVFGICLLFFVLKEGSIFQWILINGGQKGYFLPLLWVYIVFLSFYFLLGLWLKKQDRLWKILLVLFLAAFIPRLCAAIAIPYVPTNDFNNYFKYAQYMFYGKPEEVARLASSYMMPTMGGLAVYNGIIAHFFSPQLIGIQISNLITTSLICVFLFLIANERHKSIGIIAALLYAIYPSNIFSSAITTNHHAATLYFLIAIFCFSKACKALEKQRTVKGYYLAGAAALLLSISNFIHPSVIIITISIACYSLPLILWNKEKAFEWRKENRLKLASFVLILFVGTSCLHTLGIEALYRTGMVSEKDGITMLFKIAVGFNQETEGTVRNNPDGREIGALPKEEQAGEAIRRIRERTQDPKAALRLMIDKTRKTWFQRDSYFSWLYDSVKQEYAQLDEEAAKQRAQEIEDQLFLQSGLEHLDTVFLHFVYILAAVALLANRYLKDPRNIGNLMLFVPLGWILFIAISEMQPRYRYPAMPSFMLLAAIGIYEIYRTLLKWKEPLKLKS